MGALGVSVGKNKVKQPSAATCVLELETEVRRCCNGRLRVGVRVFDAGFVGADG